MQAVDDKKLIHWIRQDNADAWGRWSNTPAGRTYLVHVEKWVKEMWRKKAWRCLREWSRVRPEVACSFEKNAPDVVLSILLGNGRKEVPAYTWDLFKNIVEDAVQKGWEPKASWGWEIIHRDGSDFDLKGRHAWLLPVLELIRPDEIISDATTHHTWIDWVVSEKGDVSDRLWNNATTTHQEALQKCHENWAQWAIEQPKTTAVMMYRVGLALFGKKIQAELPKEHHLKSVIAWINKKEINQYGLEEIWFNWYDSVRLKEISSDVLKGAKSAKRVAL